MFVTHNESRRARVCETASTTTGRLGAEAGLLHPPGVPQVDGAHGGRANAALPFGEAYQQQHPDTNCLPGYAAAGHEQARRLRGIIEATASEADVALMLPTSSGCHECHDGVTALPMHRSTRRGLLHPPDVRSSTGPGRRRCAYATHSVVSPVRRGRLHSPENAQAEPREVDVRRRTTASLGHRAAGFA